MSSTVPQNSIPFRGSTNNGSFYFCIEGLPSRYTWQDLKDLIRQSAEHGIWTEMAVYPNGQTGGTGWARVQRGDEAIALFRFLENNPVNGRRLRVHLWDTTSSPPQFLMHTCGDSPCAVTARSAAAYRAAGNPSARQPASPSFAYSQPATPSVARPTYPFPVSPLPVASAAVAPQYTTQGLESRMANLSMGTSVPGRMAPAYPQGTVVNIGQGTVQTEARGVFISNIDFKAKSEDIARHFGRAGRIVRCQLQKNPSTNKFKGNATIQYSTAKEARTAVDLFNNEKWMSMRLKVRLDRATTPISAPQPIPTTNVGPSNGRSSQPGRMNVEPIIVNGSMR